MAPQRIRAPGVTLVLLIFFVLAACPEVSGEKERERGVVDEGLVPLTESWSFRWGDPVGDGATGWQAMPMPGWAPERNGNTIIRQRVILDETKFEDPAVFIPGVFLFLEAYLDGELIQTEGDLDHPESLKVKGFTWRLVDLPAQYAGKTLEFRIYSDYYLIGIGGTPVLGSRAAIMRWITSRDLGRIVAASLSLFVAVLSVLLYFGFKSESAFLYLGFFALCVGAYVFHYTWVKEFLLDLPGFWLNLWIVTVFLLPLGLLGFVRAVVTPPRVLRWFGRLVPLHLILVVLFVPPGYLFAQSIGNAVLIGLRVLYVIYIAATVAVIVPPAIKGNIEAVILSAGFLLLAGFAFHDILTALGLIPWYRPVLYFGMFCFVIAMAATLIFRSIVIYRKVEAYSKQIEAFGEERARIVDELHDGIAGLMTNINLMAEIGGKGRPAAGEPADPRGLFMRISALSREGLSEIRKFMQSMDPEECTWDNLVAAFRRHGSETLDPHGIAFEIDARVAPDTPAPDSRSFLNLSRVYHEALTNIVKHSGAASVQVSVSVTANSIVIGIADDGNGIQNGLQTGGRGFGTMKRRIAQIGGDLEIRSGRGLGLIFRIPPKNDPEKG